MELGKKVIESTISHPRAVLGTAWVGIVDRKSVSFSTYLSLPGFDFIGSTSVAQDRKKNLYAFPI